MDFLSGHGAAKPAKLDTYAKAMGLPGKGSITGADVAGLVACGEIDRVRDYCLDDVRQTAAIFLRTELVRGTLTPKLYEMSVARLKDVAVQPVQP